MNRYDRARAGRLYIRALPAHGERTVLLIVQEHTPDYYLMRWMRIS